MRKGLYTPTDYKDSCGFGLIAQIQGKTSHLLLATAIESLTCMTHRGGVAADGKTGDGCGLLIAKPHTFLQKIARDTFGVELDTDFGVGMIFLSSQSGKADTARQCLSKQINAQGLKVIGWRKVPIDPDVCGPIALQNLPVIEQVFINNCGLSLRQMETRLFVARRRTEINIIDDDSFYICSLSACLLSYKALVMPIDLARFYSDLRNTSLQTSICVFHQRFSTNTMPKWQLAQPFRMLAHNGEINTITGNRNWTQARLNKFCSAIIPDLPNLAPLVNQSGSDSSALDNILELLLLGGMDIHRALRLVMPPAWQNLDTIDADTKAFYEYNSALMEPWDGPAGVVLTDGRRAVCLLDRNGLRPARYVITKNGFITLASEIGTYCYQPEDVVCKGRVGPGQILLVDTQSNELLMTEDIEDRLKNKHPYKHWLRHQAIRIESRLENDAEFKAMDPNTLKVFMKLFQFSAEERDQVLRPLAETGQEAVGSMGDDTPIAVLSQQPRSLYDYFRQQFAQVTNPPIDSLRESMVMSLVTSIGKELNIFEQTEAHASRVTLSSPVLSPGKYEKLLRIDRSGFQALVIDLNYDPNKKSLKQAIIEVVDRAEQAIKKGNLIIVLSDRNIDQGSIPIHALLATGATHHRLINQGLRCDANIVVETATVRDSHHIAALVGFGATAIYPYLGYQVLNDLLVRGELRDAPMEAQRNYRKGLNKGLLKILSKMGISTVASYRGAQLFEALGIADEIVELCFSGVVSRIQGANFSDLEEDQRQLAKRAWLERYPIPRGGLLKYVHGAEYHAFNPETVYALQQSVKTDDYNKYRDYAGLVNNRPVTTLRDLLLLKTDCNPIPLAQVEPLESILKRFDSAGMSLGALSPEAHESLAIAMNRMGARSNSGEGGEDAVRFHTDRVSKIKQVASGRFGVTPHYLVNAEVIQIKIAQGAKPGEGGQLPGGKVNELIARLRYCAPGVTLISPPPHHDIYSIEDLAQLIFDLKQVNPDALVSVKLVSEPGVGTVASGVAKAYADLITISGYDGGTAASPLSSIRYAGSPWELGLSETQQALRSNGVRHKVRVQTDGGLKTGLDVVKAAILGAESFGFGTTPMIALGCKYLRICHLNNCATGVATQNIRLRDEHFIGTVEMVTSFFKFVAMETREILAQLGIQRLQDVIGRTDLLNVLPGFTKKQRNLDLGNLLRNDLIDEKSPQYCDQKSNTPRDKGELAEKMVSAAMQALENKSGGKFEYVITNCDRSIGARVSGEIAKRYGNQGMSESPLTINFTGTAGQSFGVWNAGGLHMILQGDANDYVGKGMAGGRIVIYPPPNSLFESQKTPIVGNTCLYGATGGELYVAGLAGERFAVRNSGSLAVIEGVGDHCCEYMTGGVVTVLGDTGYNFGAGMTGGFAFVLDLQRHFVDHFNRELIEICRISKESFGPYREYLLETIRKHANHTHSCWGQELLDNYYDYVGKFWLVKPKATSLKSLLDNIRARPE